MDSFKVLAPTRADLAGGTLDLWPLYCFLGEAKTISIALTLRVTALFEVVNQSTFRCEIVSSRSESFIFSEPLDKEAIRKLPASLQFPVFIVSRFLMGREPLPNRALKISLQTEVPLGSGLGGSSSLCVALVRGLAKLFGDYVEQGWQWRMLNWIRDVEASFLKTPTGTQDALAALFGGLRCYTSRIGGVDCSPYSGGVMEQLSERLLVLFSGESHKSELSNWEIYKRAMEGKEETMKGLEYIHQVSEQLDGELRSGHLSWKYIGQCLNEEWQVRKQMFHVETPRLDEIIQFLTSQGVLGVKVCGAAQGGSLIALVDPAQKAGLAKKCEENHIRLLKADCAKDGVQIVQ